MNISDVRLPEQVSAFIHRHSLLAGVNGLLLAVSGGADSTAMAVVLSELKKSGRICCQLAIAHLNHQLRGAASDADEAFVGQLADQLGIPFYCQRLEVKAFAAQRKLSVETAGRLLRIEALKQLASRADVDAIATAHQADDQIETLLHRLLRGTALRGLCGIWPQNKLAGMRFIRPMLAVHRAEIEDYLNACGISWQVDHTNKTLDFTRNRIRHQLLPYLKNQAPPIGLKLLALADAAQAAQARVAATAAMAAANLMRLDTSADSAQRSVCFDRQGFAGLSGWLQAELLLCAVEQLGVGLRNLSNRHIQKIISLLHSDCISYRLNWPGFITIEIDKTGIKLYC